jgi:hypothetical protein
MSKWLSAASLCVCLSACGDPHAASPKDAPADVHPDAGACWPYDTSTPKGSVELGVSDSGGAFVVMSSDLFLEYGPQGGFDVAIRSRIHGLAPGNGSNVTDPSNPRTLVHNEFIDTGLPTYNTPCPNRLGYVSDGGDSATEVVPIESLFFETLLAPDLFEKQFRVVVEVIDSTGGYAMDSKVVTVHAPPGWFMDAGMPPHITAPPGSKLQ